MPQVFKIGSYWVYFWVTAAEVSREFAERLLRMQAQKSGEEVK